MKLERSDTKLYVLYINQYVRSYYRHKNFRMSNFIFIIALVFFPTFSFARTTDSSANCLLVPEWHMFVTNDIPNDIGLYVHGYGVDLRSNLSFGQTYDWHFCPNVHEWYDGEFTWGSKNVTLKLYDKHIEKLCYRYKFLLGTQHCYWLATPEGLYVSRHNSPFPSSHWHFEKPWS